MMRVWNLQLWSMIHYPTGLENMPEYSASLGCTNASRVFSDVKTTFAVPTAPVEAVHSLDIAGSAVGTLTIAQGLPDASDIKYETFVHSSDPTLLDLIAFTQAPLPDRVDPLHETRVIVETPAFDIFTGACVRYDMTVYIPSSVSSLDIRAHGNGALQLKFDERSNFEVDALSVTIEMPDSRNLIMPHKGVRADIMTIGMASGWLVGDVTIVNETRLGREDGNMTLNAHIYPAPSHEDPPAPANLDTTTGSGPSSYIFYMADAGHSRRPIHSVHRSLGEDMLWLVYPQVTVNGTVNITASNYPGGRLEHHDPDGPDSIVSQSDGPIVFFAHSF
ncbi:uncharacterized protein LAESUDRAFT_727823 [Laetiporus sulphureus 93-53]|uniref:Uncharacterized protein n=1 Tax=Laetiporus sulphureus 93-53 TaxID=1314785 RepID=A0A165DDM5_9APHY|nr:uncharacterized protein LAESUDRAFT_727823 [Laetiporus sulphureus 93-53]KZT04644.1 hypothetical protein LAESUDRAFT_727823 [Laetiporus sulphureus 93-53]